MTAAVASSKTERIVRVACKVTPEQQRTLEECAVSFWEFLPYWKFKNRETGAVIAFDRVWRGQADLAEQMEAHDWLFALKAGKLGFSELACAWDGWKLRFGQPNARVHLFSRDERASVDLLAWVRFGLDHLPEWMRLPVVMDEAGSNTSRSLKLYAGPDDVRTVVSYAAGQNVSIDQTCQHAHVDEFARMPFGEKMWQAIETTVSPFGGTCHVVTRGAGPNFAARMWRDAMAGRSKLHAFFAPYDARPGRGKRDGTPAQRKASDAWLAKEAETLTHAGLWQWAPTSWQQAIQGDESYVYPQFDNPPGRHVLSADPCPLADCRRVGVGIDPGAVNPTAMGLWGERSSGRVHLYAEFYVTNCGIDEIETQLVEWSKWAKRVLRVWVPRDEKTLRATLESHGFDAQAAVTDIKLGIQLVTERLNTNGLTVHRDCARHIEEFQDYRNTTATDRTTHVEYAGDRPIKHHADAMDEMRYAVSGFATWAEAVGPQRGRSGRVYGG